MAPNPSILAIQRASAAKGLDWRTLASVSQYESGLNPRALGDGGHAFGLFQNNNAGGTITGDPNPQRFFDPNVAAGYTANAVSKLGLAGMTPAQQIHAIVYRYERPADPAKEYAAALGNYQSRFASAPAGAPAAPAPPAAAPRFGAGAPPPASAAAPAPDFSALQLGLNSAADTQARAQSALSAISGVERPAVPALDLSTLVGGGPLAPTVHSQTTTVHPSDHVVQVGGVKAPDTKGLSPQAIKAVKIAHQLIGVPYIFGGTDPKKGLDCSALVQYIAAQNGVKVPRTAAEQFNVGTPVDRRDLTPGTPIFFRDSTGIHHEALYIGGPQHQFVQAPHTGDHVKISSLDEPYYSAQFAGGRKIF